MSGDSYAAIYAVVRAIPAGAVATYGQVAQLAGLEGRARQVGYALHRLQTEDVPWHRVINAHGRISLPEESGAAEKQRTRLLDEGVSFDPSGRIDLNRFGFKA